MCVRFCFPPPILGILLVQCTNVLSDVSHRGSTSHVLTLQLIVLPLKLRCGVVGSLSTPSRKSTYLTSRRGCSERPRSPQTLFLTFQLHFPNLGGEWIKTDGFPIKGPGPFNETATGTLCSHAHVFTEATSPQRAVLPSHTCAHKPSSRPHR